MTRRTGKLPSRITSRPAERVRTLDRAAGTEKREAGTPWARKRRQAWLKAKGACYVCGTITENHGREYGFDLDHITPLADGGTNDPDNLGVICKPCHAIKTADENSERGW